MNLPKPALCELACPDCRTVVSGSAVECPHCRLPLDWLHHDDDYQEFREALQIDSTASEMGENRRALHLHLRIVSSRGETCWSERLDSLTGSRRVFLPDQNAESIELLSANRQTVRIQYGADTAEIALPGRHSVGEISLTCRLTAETTVEPESWTKVREDVLKRIALDNAKCVTIGRGRECADGQVPSLPEIALRHSVLVRVENIADPQTGTTGPGVFLADSGSQTGTFINGRPIGSIRLQTGDLVQIGPFAWTFDGEGERLLPVAPIAGVMIRTDNLRVGSGDKLRLDVEVCGIPAGEFAAIVGPSGSGKSTLLKLLAGIPDRGLRKKGRVLVRDDDGEYDINQDPSRFQDVLGYVPQEQIVHKDLSARQAVMFRTKLRGKRRLGKEIDEVLYQVDLPRNRQRAPIRKLSGGEARRVATAVELITGPRLLLLDEPGSGLDEQRERELMTFLRNLSLRGCTVVIVTHNGRLAKEFCTRLISIRSGRIEKRAVTGTIGMDAELPASEPLPVESNDAPGQATISGPAISSEPRTDTPLGRTALRDRFREFRRQFGTLFHREGAILRGDPLRRLLLPALVVPMIFAGSLAIAVERQSPGLLGFFSILAVIWMGTSLSLMAIVVEREIFEHERRLFLRIPPYLAAKVAILGIVSLVQTLVFFVLSTAIRCPLGADRLDALHGADPLSWSTSGEVFLVLVLVGWTAVGSGLLISAAVGQSREAANFLLPLFMIAQIVFSVPISMGTSEDSLQRAYSPFSFHHSRSKTSDVDADNEENLRLWSGRISLATISRYGDITLRSFAYHDISHETDATKDRNRRWFREALGVLCAILLGLPILTGLILYGQSGRAAFLSRKTTSWPSASVRSAGPTFVAEFPTGRPPPS